MKYFFLIFAGIYEYPQVMNLIFLKILYISRVKCVFYFEF